MAGLTGREILRKAVHMSFGGVAFALRAGIEGLAAIGLPYQEYRLIGGGAKSKLWAQIVCDVLGHDLLLPKEQDAAYGAALITAVAASLIDPMAVSNLIRIETRLAPDPVRQAMYDDLFDIYLDADRRLVEIAHRLTAFETRSVETATNQPG